MATEDAPAPRLTRRGLGELLAAATRDPADELLLQLVDVALAGVVFFAPLVLAGRHPWGQLVLVVLVSLASIAWAFHQARRRRGSWNRSGVEGLLLAGTGLLVLQVLPLPADWLDSLSPRLPDVLPLWTGEGAANIGLGRWSQLSLHPEATRGGLVMYLAHALLFLVVVQRIQSREDAERLVRWVALAVTGMALLGLFQLLISRGNFLWLGHQPAQSTRGVVTGTFASENQFAHFLALGLGPLVWWGHRRITPGGKRRRFSQKRPYDAQEQVARMVLGGAFVVVGLAGLLTFSRGGLLAMLSAAAACGAVFWFHGLSGQRALWGGLGVGALLCAGLWTYGYEPLMAEWRTLAGDARQQLDRSSVQRQRWLGAMRATADFPLVGTGAGTYQDVAPSYVAETPASDGTDGENGYFRVCQETGLAGLLLLLAGIGCALKWCGRLIRKAGDPSLAGLAGAITASVVASLVHSLVDFVWYVPACLSMTLILTACGCRLSQLTRSPPRRPLALSRTAWIGVVLALLLVSFGMVRNRLPRALAAASWDRHVALARALEPTIDAATAANLGTPPAAGVSPEFADAMRRHLKRVLEANPRDAQAHLRLAQWSVKAFELGRQQAGNPMGLREIRDAAQAFRFASSSELNQWLERVAGAERQLLHEALSHTRRALQLSPLQGEGYVHLGELAFLEMRDANVTLACLDQAVRARPHNPTVLLAVSRESALVGKRFELDGDAPRHRFEAPGTQTWPAGRAPWRR